MAAFAKIRSPSSYTLHSYYATGGNSFAIYQVSDGKGHDGDGLAGFGINNVYFRKVLCLSYTLFWESLLGRGGVNAFHLYGFS